MSCKLTQLPTINKSGFTLAEVLITLVIIGVIAAMTISTVIGNSRRTEVETKLKVIHSLLNNALTKAVADYGPAYTWEEMGEKEERIQRDVFHKYIEPYLKFSRELGEVSIEEIGYDNGIYKPDGEKVGMKNPGKLSSFAVLQNGITILTVSEGWYYYNPDDETVPPGYVSSMYYFDINGPKGANTVGKDIFPFCMFTFTGKPKFDTMGLYTVPDGEDIEDMSKYWEVDYKEIPKEDQISVCKDSGMFCGALIQQNGWKIPKDYPLNI